MLCIILFLTSECCLFAPPFHFQFGRKDFLSERTDIVRTGHEAKRPVTRETEFSIPRWGPIVFWVGANRSGANRLGG